MLSPTQFSGIKRGHIRVSIRFDIPVHVRVAPGLTRKLMIFFFVFVFFVLTTEFSSTVSNYNTILYLNLCFHRRVRGKVLLRYIPSAYYLYAAFLTASRTVGEYQWTKRYIYMGGIYIHVSKDLSSRG